MRSRVATVLLACASSLSLGREATVFSFEGFSLGMSRSDATAIRPDTPWKQVMRGTPSEAVRKEFKASHLGQEAQVNVDLSASGGAVEVIGFTFLTQTDQQCIQEAVKALVELEKLYGVEAEVSHQQPGKRAKWLTNEGTTVRWFELCAVGARRYVITYAKVAPNPSIEMRSPGKPGAASHVKR